ncbi:MAG: hypothetical protein ACYC0V_11895 [Armatimonadota bacterium]
MGIAFTQDDWTRVQANHRKWWNGELSRPLLQFTIANRTPGRPEPSLPNLGFTSHFDFSVNPDEIVDRWDYNLSCCNFLGDAFPSALPNFGPGCAAAFMGAELLNGAETSWFHPTEDVEIGGLQLEYIQDNIWFNRVKDIYRAAIKRWDGNVQLSMTDLGGNLDLLSTFRPGEKLLFDLYDYPQEVKEKTWDAHRMWWKYFDEINGIIQPTNPGYTAWASILSPDVPYYMLQCDFCYMIGPEMFDEFVKPELAESCKRLGNAFYHLDGPGQLPHLDSLLTIKELKGVQWVPGSGVPGWEHWPEVYRRIRDAGKLIQVYGDGNTLDAIYEQTDGYDGIVLIGWTPDEDHARKTLKKYGAE